MSRAGRAETTLPSVATFDSSPKAKPRSPAKTPAAQKGHKVILSGSTVVGRSRKHSGHESSPDDGSNELELDPTTSEFVPGTRQQQPKPPQGSSGRKHHCSTEAAISERRRIYIGNLDFTLDRDNIAGLLGEYDVYKPECCCIYVPPPSLRKNPKTKDEHRNRGYCFATFTDSESATAAMQALDHIEFAGRKLVCRCCLPKGVPYNEHLKRSDFIEQRGVLEFLPQPPPPQDDSEGEDQQHFPLPESCFPHNASHMSSYGGSNPNRRPKSDRHHHYHHYHSVGSARQQHQEHPERPGHSRSLHHRYQQRKYDRFLVQPTYTPYDHYPRCYDDPHGVAGQPQVMIPEPIMSMPKYYPDPCSDHRAVLLDSFKQDAAVEANDGGIDFEMDYLDVYKPPADSSHASGRTVELLNLAPVPGCYRGFKAFIEKLLEKTECNVTGVSEAIYQYDPHRPLFPLRPCPPEVAHNCPLFYCYVQLATKEQAKRAFKELNGMKIFHGGDIRQYRVNMEWNLPGSG
ncbi:hypothetical protein PG999_013531 [Apiospora kogelbergensis]|uniref:RRM domain-containing protein n=1 Tax=Apiospora kogelbergensis TaxID=1337665 RepID=A0AAW0QK38_9PEZI